MAVPYTTREMAKKIAEEVVKEHGGGGGSSYTAGNGIKIENNEIEVDDEVVVTKEDFDGRMAINNTEMIFSKPYSSGTSAIAFFDIFSLVNGDGDPDTDTSAVCLLNTNVEDMNNPISTVFALNKDGLVYVADGNTGGIKSIIAPGVVTFVSNSDDLSLGIEFPVTVSEKVAIFNSILYQITSGTCQLPMFQVVKKQTGNQNKDIVLSSEVTVKPYFENIEEENGIILFDFNKNGDDYGTTYELTKYGEWRPSEE